MSVRMTGGNSGCREDYLANVPTGGEPQPVLDTSTSKQPNPGSVVFQANRFNNKVDAEDHATPDFMPNGGSIPTGSTDVQEQGLPSGDSKPLREVMRQIPGA